MVGCPAHSTLPSLVKLEIKRLLQIGFHSPPDSPPPQKILTFCAGTQSAMRWNLGHLWATYIYRGRSLKRAAGSRGRRLLGEVFTPDTLLDVARNNAQLAARIRSQADAVACGSSGLKPIRRRAPSAAQPEIRKHTTWPPRDLRGPRTRCVTSSLHGTSPSSELRGSAWTLRPKKSWVRSRRPSPEGPRATL